MRGKCCKYLPSCLWSAGVRISLLCDGQIGIIILALLTLSQENILKPCYPESSYVKWEKEQPSHETAQGFNKIIWVKVVLTYIAIANSHWVLSSYIGSAQILPGTDKFCTRIVIILSHSISLYLNTFRTSVFFGSKSLLSKWTSLLLLLTQTFKLLC